MKSKIFEVAISLVLGLLVFVTIFNVVDPQLTTSIFIAIAFFGLGFFTNSRPKWLRMPLKVVSIGTLIAVGFVFEQWPDTDNVFAALPWAMGYLSVYLANAKWTLIDAKADIATTESE